MRPEDEDGAVKCAAGRDFEPARTLAAAWTERMRSGDFAAAWQVSDRARHLLAGRRTDMLPRHLQSIWNGESLAGKRVLIRCYHGLGDTIQFIRYVPMVRRLAREVTVWAQPELIPLLAQVRAIDRLLPLHNGAPEADYDVDVEIMELPYVFRSTVWDLPGRGAYLRAAPSPRATPSENLAVGLVWQAGEWDERRSIPTERMLRLKGTPGVTFHILQLGKPGGELLRSFGVDARTPHLESAAGVIAGLDLMISVDSMPAHLAGALGVPTWTLLAEPADWRWMSLGNHSRWYPTMRLFRQPEPGDWEGVLEEVAAALPTWRWHQTLKR